MASADGFGRTAFGGTLPVPTGQTRTINLAEEVTIIAMKDEKGGSNANLYFTTPSAKILAGDVAALPLKKRFGVDPAGSLPLFAFARLATAIPEAPGAGADDMWAAMRAALVINDDNAAAAGQEAESAVLTNMTAAMSRIQEVHAALQSAMRELKATSDEDREEAQDQVKELNDEFDMIHAVVKAFLSDITQVFEAGFIVSDVDGFRDAVVASEAMTDMKGIKTLTQAILDGRRLYALHVVDNLREKEDDMVRNGGVVMEKPTTMGSLAEYETIVNRVYDYHESIGEISPNQDDRAERLAITRILSSDLDRNSAK